MIKVCIIGRLNISEGVADGQSIKTRIVYREFQDTIGYDNVISFDTNGGIKNWIKLPFTLLCILKKCNNIVILPAENGLRVIVPMIFLMNIIFNRKLYYDVIGGWLPEFIRKRYVLKHFLKTFNAIFVETEHMKSSLCKMGFSNIFVVPNCKKLSIVNKNDLRETLCPPYQLCTFSRVIKEKGIAEAVYAVKKLNKQHERSIYKLSIYGPVDDKQNEWFTKLSSDFTEDIQYKGVIPYEKSTSELMRFDALLFPTYYSGEGFAGTIIDSMAAGVPIIASDWKSNSEIIRHEHTGLIFKTKSEEELMRSIERIFQEPYIWNKMKQECIIEATRYLPSNAMRTIFDLIYSNEEN